MQRDNDTFNFPLMSKNLASHNHSQISSSKLAYVTVNLVLATLLTT